MILYDEEEIMRSYVKSEAYEARQDEKIESAKRMLKKGKLSIEEIAEYLNLPIETVLELQKQEKMQSV